MVQSKNTVLSSSQLKVISDIVSDGSITIRTLKEDVIDHLCCVVEHKLENGMSFEQAIKEALIELAPDGLQEIEEETIFLFNVNKSIHMKKVMYSIGLISSMVMSLGWLFRIFQWPGGPELSNYGFFVFALLFVPMLAINQFNISIKKTIPEKLRIMLGLFSGVVTCIAVFFKIMHLPGADYLMLTGGLLFIFGFLPMLFLTMYKKSIS